MNHLSLWPSAAAAAGVIALATATPVLANDARLATRLYNANEVVRIEGRAGVQASIAFGADEHIENVAIGDSGSWQVTPNKRANVLFVKPMQARARTNLTVITDQRSYFFDLVASPTGQAIYSLQFTYRDAPRHSAAVAPPPSASPAEFALPTDPSKLNHAWRSRGKSSLLPTRVYDDGNSLYLTWPQGARMPAILVRNQKGEEGPVNFAVRGDTIVTEGVPREVILRSGRDRAVLENRGSARSPSLPTGQTAASQLPNQGS